MIANQDEILAALKAANIPVDGMNSDGVIFYRGAATSEQKKQAEGIRDGLRKGTGWVEEKAAAQQRQRTTDIDFLQSQWGKLSEVEKALARLCGAQEP